MTRQTALFVAFILLFPGVSFAQKYEPKNIPKCKVEDLKSGGKGCVYTLEQVKQLYVFDSKMTEQVALNKAKALQIKQLLLAVENLKKQVTLALENAKSFSKRVGELTKLYIKTDKLYQNCRAKPMIGNYIAWGSLILVSAGCVGYIAGNELHR